MWWRMPVDSVGAMKGGAYLPALIPARAAGADVVEKGRLIRKNQLEWVSVPAFKWGTRPARETNGPS